MCYKSVSFLYPVTKLLFSHQFNEKGLAIFLVSDYGTLMSTTTGDNSNCWWCWTVLSPIVELQYVRLWILLMILMVLNCILSSYLGYSYSYILRQEFQWRWNMSRFTHIAFVSFSDGFIGFLLCVLYFLCICISIKQFVFTESYYELTGIHEPIDELYI